MSRSKETILVEIAREEQRLADLERALAEARARREQLLSKLEAASSTTSPVWSLPSAGNGKTPHTPADKVQAVPVALPRARDVFPTRFVSKKTGKPGYAPACSNKFGPGVCELAERSSAASARTRRSSRSTTRPSSTTSRAGTSWASIRSSRTRRAGSSRSTSTRAPGRRTCAAFVETVPARRACPSRSSARVRATARTCGSSSARRCPRTSRGRWAATSSPRRCRRRHELSMESYDRLFPSQDTMPRGGFGNLIALPLQHEPRQHGNTRLPRRAISSRTRRPAVGLSWRPSRASIRSAVEAIAREATARDRWSASASPRRRRRGDERRRGRGRPQDVPAVGRIAGPLPTRGARRARAAALRREGGLPSPLLEPDQAARRLPEPRVLQEAEHAPLDGDDAAGDRLRRGTRRSTSPCRAAACASSRRSCASTAWRWTSRTNARTASRSTFAFHGELTAGPEEAAARAPRARHRRLRRAARASARRCVGTYLVAAARLQHARSSSTAGRCSTSGSRSSRCSSASTRRRSARSAAGKRKPQRSPRRGDDPEPRPQGARSTTSSPATARSSSTSATTCPRSRSSACLPR